MDRKAIDGLATRCELAEGPNYEIDYAVAKLLDKWELGGTQQPKPPRFTGGLDAAASLVPEGWGYRVWVSENRQHASATVDTSHPINRAGFGECTSPALALCAASLRALAFEGA